MVYFNHYTILAIKYYTWLGERTLIRPHLVLIKQTKEIIFYIERLSVFV